MHIRFASVLNVFHLWSKNAWCFKPFHDLRRETSSEVEKERVMFGVCWEIEEEEVVLRGVGAGNIVVIQVYGLTSRPHNVGFTTLHTKQLP